MVFNSLQISAGQHGAVHISPQSYSLARVTLVHQEQVFVYTGVLSIFFPNVKGLESVVLRCSDSKCLEAHPVVDIINREEGYVKGDLVKRWKKVSRK